MSDEGTSPAGCEPGPASAAGVTASNANAPAVQAPPSLPPSLPGTAPMPCGAVPRAAPERPTSYLELLGVQEEQAQQDQLAPQQQLQAQHAQQQLVVPQPPQQQQPPVVETSQHAPQRQQQLPASHLPAVQQPSQHAQQLQLQPPAPQPPAISRPAGPAGFPLEAATAAIATDAEHAWQEMPPPPRRQLQVSWSGLGYFCCAFMDFLVKAWQCMYRHLHTCNVCCVAHSPEPLLYFLLCRANGLPAQALRYRAWHSVQRAAHAHRCRPPQFGWAALKGRALFKPSGRLVLVHSSQPQLRGRPARVRSSQPRRNGQAARPQFRWTSHLASSSHKASYTCHTMPALPSPPCSSKGSMGSSRGSRNRGSKNRGSNGAPLAHRRPCSRRRSPPRGSACRRSSQRASRAPARKARRSATRRASSA